VEAFLEKTVQLFSYLTDKDLFAEIYRTNSPKGCSISARPRTMRKD